MMEFLEQVRFRAAAGASREEVVAELVACEGWLARQPGFLERWLGAPGDDGEWVDVVRWRSEAEAKAAAEAAMTDPSFAAHMRVIDPESVVMEHRPLVRRSG